MKEAEEWKKGQYKIESGIIGSKLFTKSAFIPLKLSAHYQLWNDTIGFRDIHFSD